MVDRQRKRQDVGPVVNREEFLSHHVSMKLHRGLKWFQPRMSYHLVLLPQIRFRRLESSVHSRLGGHVITLDGRGEPGRVLPGRMDARLSHLADSA